MRDSILLQVFCEHVLDKVLCNHIVNTSKDIPIHRINLLDAKHPSGVKQSMYACASHLTTPYNDLQISGGIILSKTG